MITTLNVEKVSPEGRVVEIDHEFAVPPELVGVSVVMALSTRAMTVLGEYEIDGAWSEAVTAKLTIALSDPAELVPATV